MFQEELISTTAQERRRTATVKIPTKEYQLLFALYLTLWDVDQDPCRATWAQTVNAFTVLVEYYSTARTGPEDYSIEKREYEFLCRLFLSLWTLDQDLRQEHRQQVVRNFRTLSQFYDGERA